MDDQPVQGETGGTGEQGGTPRREQARAAAEQARAAAEKMIGQLQVMIDQAGKTAGPVLRDVAAKAAELTAVAAANAGPVAHKAANVTEHVGDRLATRSKELASDLRKAAEAARAQNAAEPDTTPTDVADEPKDGGPVI